MKHEFVEHIPEALELHVLYIAIEHDVAVHSCFCGCGLEVVTPLSPAQWSLNYDGRTVSLSPSIGNWSFPCKSHYWIRRGRVEWSTRFSDAKIDAVKAKDKADLARLVQTKPAPLEQPTPIDSTGSAQVVVPAPPEAKARVKRWSFVRLFDFLK